MGMRAGESEQKISSVKVMKEGEESQLQSGYGQPARVQHGAVQPRLTALRGSAVAQGAELGPGAGRLRDHAGLSAERDF